MFLMLIAYSLKRRNTRIWLSFINLLLLILWHSILMLLRNAAPSQTNTKFQGKNNGSKRHVSSYFCTHCKVPGHSYERCFKVHGYPPDFKGFKDKKIAVYSSSYSDSQSLTESTSSERPYAFSHSEASPSISIEQYNYLVELLNKQSSLS